MFVIDNNNVRVTRQIFNSEIEINKFIKKEQEKYKKEGWDINSKESINPFNWKISK